MGYQRLTFYSDFYSFNDYPREVYCFEMKRCIFFGHLSRSGRTVYT